MKKSIVFLLMALLSLTASAAYRTFQVNGIYYEQTEAADDFVSVSYVPEGGPMYKGDIVIPATVSYGGKTFPVKKIGQGAFYGCTGLTSIVLPEGLEEIENSSFYGCTALKGITFPSTLNNIRGYLITGDTGAFEGCTGLKSIYLPSSIDESIPFRGEVGNTTFKNCTGLKTIYVKGNNTVIGMYDVFSGCYSVTDFVSYIENPAAHYVDARSFEGIPQTANLIVPDGMKTAYQNAREWYTFQHIYERSSYSKAFAVLTAGIGGKLTYNNDNVWRATQVYGVQKGQSVTVTITPDEGHSLLRLLKDGQDVTAQVSNGKYTVQNMQQDFTLEAVFQEGTTPGPQPGGGGTARLSIEPFNIKAGETATMLIDLINPDDEITALDFFLQLPEGLSIAMENGEPAVDIAGRTTWKKHTLTVNTTDGHIMLYSATNTTVSGTSGALISVKLQASSTFAGGNIVLKNQTLNTPVPVVSKPADYVYTVEGGAVESPVLTADITIKNIVDGIVYSYHADIICQWNNVGSVAFKGIVHRDFYRWSNGQWLLIENCTDEDELSLGAGKSSSPISTGLYTSNGKYKYELWYQREGTNEHLVAGTAEFELILNGDRWAVVMNDYGMMTYCENQDLDFSDVSGLKAYTAGGFNTATGEALMMRVGDVPANTGLLLIGNPGQCYLVPRRTSSTIYVNMLVGVISTEKIEPVSDGYKNYYFSEDSRRFKAVTEYYNYIYSNSAYLQIPAQAAGSRQTITLKFDDTMGIGEVGSDVRPFDVYTVSGQVVKRGVTSLKGLPAGIYIVGGRKVVVR